MLNLGYQSRKIDKTDYGHGRKTKKCQERYVANRSGEHLEGDRAEKKCRENTEYYKLAQGNKNQFREF